MPDIAVVPTPLRTEHEGITLPKDSEGDDLVESLVSELPRPSKDLVWAAGRLREFLKRVHVWQKVPYGSLYYPGVVLTEAERRYSTVRDTMSVATDAVSLLTNYIVCYVTFKHVREAIQLKGRLFSLHKQTHRGSALLRETASPYKSYHTSPIILRCKLNLSAGRHPRYITASVDDVYVNALCHWYVGTA